MRRLVVLVAMAALLGGITGATVETAAAAKPSMRARALKLRPKPFSSCTNLVKYARSHAAREIRYAGGPVTAPAAPPTFAQTDDTAGGDGTRGESSATPAPATPSTDSSQTNVQEQGVDEPDIVKTDGQTIFAIANGRLNAIDARAATPKLLSSLELGFYSGDMLLHGHRLLVISYANSPVQVSPAQPANGRQAVAPGEP